MQNQYSYYRRVNNHTTKIVRKSAINKKIKDSNEAILKLTSIFQILADHFFYFLSTWMWNFCFDIYRSSNKRYSLAAEWSLLYQHCSLIAIINVHKAHNTWRFAFAHYCLVLEVYSLLANFHILTMLLFKLGIKLLT